MNMSTIENTILNQEMKAATAPGDAWYNGDQYFLATEAEAYKAFSAEHLASLLRSGGKLQRENGYLYLYEDPTMPADARVDIIHKPSYAMAAIGIYAQLHYPEIFDAELDRVFRGLLEGAFMRGIVGHGIDHEETVRRTLLMLCKAGLRDFLDAQGEKYPVFSKSIMQHMTHFFDLNRRIDEEQIIITANHFATESINHLVKELVAYWNGNSCPVFVYGTLMRGERANAMLGIGEFAGCFLLKDFAMYNLGQYPGIRHCPNESVYGELYFVSPDVVKQLDGYEGEGSLYTRTTVQLSAGHKVFLAEAYIYNHDVSSCTKMREEWNASDEDLVWYAGYGSNLSSERFDCYISGGTCAENGRTYSGSSDPTPPRAVKTRVYPGGLYFGNRSASWSGCGVAFYDLNPENKDALVYMKCYLITRRQLHDVMEQEGKSPNWYGRLVRLEVDNNGIPVYTLTSETRRTETPPAPEYVALISGVLEKEFNLRKHQIKNYLRK